MAIYEADSSLGQRRSSAYDPLNIQTSSSPGRRPYGVSCTPAGSDQN
jgi:hypothetical protein